MIVYIAVTGKTKDKPNVQYFTDFSLNVAHANLTRTLDALIANGADE